MTGVYIGAPIRGWQVEELTILNFNTRTWLGQRSANKTDVWTVPQPMLGPITSSGLAFQYLDSTMTVTTNPSLIASIRFVVRGESQARARTGTGAIDYIRDSSLTQVWLRNNRRY